MRILAVILNTNLNLKVIGIRLFRAYHILQILIFPSFEISLNSHCRIAPDGSRLDESAIETNGTSSSSSTITPETSVECSMPDKDADDALLAPNTTNVAAVVPLA
jgi:hypothetical protein